MAGMAEEFFCPQIARINADTADRAFLHGYRYPRGVECDEDVASTLTDLSSFSWFVLGPRMA